MRFIATDFLRSRTSLLLSRQNLPTTKQKPFMLGKGGGSHSWSSFNESLSSLLKRSPTHSHLQEARRLHALMLVGSILNPDSDIAGPASLLGSRLVQVYAQLGCLEEALLAFGRLHCVHNIACNAILRAYVDSAHFSQAIHFFNHLVFKLGFMPDNYTCPLILKACSELCALEEGRKTHDLIRSAEVHYCFKPNVYTKCALIDMFAKCGSLDEARMVFDDMPQKERDLASWTAMICGTIHQGHGQEALYLFNTMRREGTDPDSVVMAAILPACGRLGARQEGMALQGCALKSGFHCDLFVSNAVMDMYCKFGDTHQAYSVFCRMPCKDVVSWSTLIAGYSQNCEYERSLVLYLEMINLGVKPSAIIVASILPTLGKLNLSEHGKVMHGFILKKGFDSDVVVSCALIEMYSSCGLAGGLEVLLSLWSDWDIMVWNSAIAGHAACENFNLALSVFRKIWKSKCKPNCITLVSILPICTKMGALKQGMEVHCHAIRSSLIGAVSVGNSLIDMYCKCGYLGHGLKVFDHMMEKDIVSYNTIISAYGFHGYGKQALVLFDEMKSLAMKPSKATFVGLLSACSHAGLVDEGRSLYISMINSYGILPNMEHYSCMVDLLGRAGHICDACNFIRTMPEEPDGNVLGCLLAACRVHNMVEPAYLLAKEILQDKLEDSGYHILLSNMYASTKKWKDASRVRVLIKEKGLRKKPGKSWIQIGHCTHIFDARDTTHSEYNKIQVFLETLMSEMREPCVVDPCFSLPSL
ncbi:pentatricopeptide repeat-containing protein At1g06140, mitochondrial-like [Sesamum indicum]|uniref:Pentatricopeptide repeat-containing protein At1g06140, mitochondrial-like n=1 Tax=Sesamum indicum TaxID=4182 RepID=A0A6I9T704_SESIN|nr:pentatricopeptide repeat-containing protein At1g06140, mitochondrial-like [Sesamum indicum]